MKIVVVQIVLIYIVCMIDNNFELFMNMAFREANLAYQDEEVPVGAIVVFEDKIIGRGHNQTMQLHDATAHAEMIALSAAYNHFGDWRLENCDLYCTLEPCTMCAGAAVLSRINRIIYGAKDPKFGACGSIFNVPTEKKLNHRIEVISGIMENEISALMKQFFAEIRNKKEQIN